VSFAVLVTLVQQDYLEMPGLALTLPQAARLWNATQDECSSVIDAMVRSGFLRWTANGKIVRSGGDLGVLARKAG